MVRIRPLLLAVPALALLTGAAAASPVGVPSAAAGPRDDAPGAGAAAERSAPAYDRPLTSFVHANPGVARVGTRWVSWSTTGARSTGRVINAPRADGPWRAIPDRPLLTSVPRWMDGGFAVWAPSVVRATDGRWVAYYAGVVKGRAPSRCIGTGIGTRPSGPFTPTQRPIACFDGSGASGRDSFPSEGRGFKLIDPTATVVAQDEYWLTFKTSLHLRDGFHSTTRILRLDPAKPFRPLRPSKRITSWRSPTIEENPVLVERNGVYTLFTSRGFYGRCTGTYAYRTAYRQSRNPLDFPRSPVRLSFPRGTNVCGYGNAHIVRAADNLTSDSWRIFWNGRWPAAKDGFHLYAGRVSWPGGKPVVSKVYAPR
jgi:hypothetical protein